MQNQETPKKFLEWGQLEAIDQQKFLHKIEEEWKRAPLLILPYLWRFHRMMEISGLTFQQVACLRYLGKLPDDETPIKKVLEANKNFRSVMLRAIKSEKEIGWLTAMIAYSEVIFFDRK